MKAGQTVFTELEFDFHSGHGKGFKAPVCDLLWLEELMVLEFESNYSKDGADFKCRQYPKFNVFVFDVKKESVESVLKRIGCDVVGN